MGRIAKLITLATILIVAAPTLYASDWGIVGKVLTGIEGTRLITGGKVDIIGALTGMDDSRYYAPRSTYRSWHTHSDSCACRRVWVPTTVRRKEWVPTHKEYDHWGREIIVKGHYITYEVESGGYWQTSCPYRKRYRYSRWHR